VVWWVVLCKVMNGFLMADGLLEILLLQRAYDVL